MAKKNQLVVVTAVGTITRTTARTYAFVITARGESHESVSRWHRHYVESAQSGVTYRKAQLAGTEKVYDWEPRAEIADKLAQSEQWLANADALLAEKLAAADAALVTPLEGAAGAQWAGRLDLALKAAKKLQETYRDVRVFEVATGKQVAGTMTGK